MLEQRKARIAEAEANAEKIKSELAETESARDKILDMLVDLLRNPN